MSVRVLGTGASGFIAQQLVIDLLSKGYEVRGTIRSLAKADRLRAIYAEHTDVAAIFYLLGNLITVDLDI